MSEAGEQTTESLTEAIRRVLKENSLATLITIIESSKGIGAKLLVDEKGERTGTLGDAELDNALSRSAESFLSSRVEAATFYVNELAPGVANEGDARILCERIEPEPRLIICGAGHVGASLAKLASLIGYRTTLVDDRPDFLTRERFPNEGIELVLAKGWRDALISSIGSGRNVSVAVVTRGHNEDEECMHAVLETRPDYMGLIGSRRRTNIVLERLRDTGIDEMILKEVRAPIGLDIGAVSPEEVALAILAEIVAKRRGAGGSSLSAWRRAERSGDQG